MGGVRKSVYPNRGYNKFLVLEGELTIRIDPGKIEEDQQWDGLKGYLTNTQLSAGKVIENDSHLWQIERAFRISKTEFQ